MNKGFIRLIKLRTFFIKLRTFFASKSQNPWITWAHLWTFHSKKKLIFRDLKYKNKLAGEVFKLCLWKYYVSRLNFHWSPSTAVYGQHLSPFYSLCAPSCVICVLPCTFGLMKKNSCNVIITFINSNLINICNTI